jgi:5-methyltetrahydropteroyltriglutamate--homocysteine methyltransferase
MAQNRIPVTHVGSLIRPPKLTEFNTAIAEGKPYSGSAYEACLTQSIADVVRQQADTGIDIASDGEFGKTGSWSRYIEPRLTGIAIRPLTEEEFKDPWMSPHGGRDRAAFREFYNEYDDATGFSRRMGIRCIVNGPITYVGQKLVQRDIANLKAAAKAAQVDAFLPVVAPASALPYPTDEYYGKDEKFLWALADALHEEYKAVTDAGLIAQIDDAFLPYMHEKMVPPASLKQYLKWADLRVEALNHALTGIPEERSRYHICWGSWNGPHVFDVPIKDILPIILKIKVGAYSFEAANPRHQHEWKAWKDVKVPKGKRLMPGAVTHSTNIVEHPELVAERLIRYASIVGKENVIAGTDCGFAQSPFAKRVHETIQWAKLEALAEGAKIASRQLWGKSKPKRKAA